MVPDSLGARTAPLRGNSYQKARTPPKHPQELPARSAEPGGVQAANSTPRSRTGRRSQLFPPGSQSSAARLSRSPLAARGERGTPPPPPPPPGQPSRQLCGGLAGPAGLLRRSPPPQGTPGCGGRAPALPRYGTWQRGRAGPRALASAAAAPGPSVLEGQAGHRGPPERHCRAPDSSRCSARARHPRASR